MDKYLLTDDELGSGWNIDMGYTEYLNSVKVTTAKLSDRIMELEKKVLTIREEVRKETAEEILEYISDLKMIKDNQEDAERFECLRIKYGIEGK
jgi:hypothetical protein